jgi:hypothetical protein
LSLGDLSPGPIPATRLLVAMFGSNCCAMRWHADETLRTLLANPRQHGANRPGMLHELEHDGFRLTVHRDGESVHLFTRRGYDWADRFPRIVGQAKRLKSPRLVVRAEAVFHSDDGVCGEAGVVVNPLLARPPTIYAQFGSLLPSPLHRDVASCLLHSGAANLLQSSLNQVIVITSPTFQVCAPLRGKLFIATAHRRGCCSVQIDRFGRCLLCLMPKTNVCFVSRCIDFSLGSGAARRQK